MKGGDSPAIFHIQSSWQGYCSSLQFAVCCPCECALDWATALQEKRTKTAPRFQEQPKAVVTLSRAFNISLSYFCSCNKWVDTTLCGTTQQHGLWSWPTFKNQKYTLISLKTKTNPLDCIETLSKSILVAIALVFWIGTDKWKPRGFNSCPGQVILSQYLCLTFKVADLKLLDMCSSGPLQDEQAPEDNIVISPKRCLTTYHSANHGHDEGYPCSELPAW